MKGNKELSPYPQAIRFAVQPYEQILMEARVHPASIKRELKRLDEVTTKPRQDLFVNTVIEIMSPTPKLGHTTVFDSRSRA
ncbi:MAG: hypothetical protein US43_C0011G0018 [Candidatus Levybacteria bacterium GW2011_GWA1_37_16]|nr:MAG: hypothetical protein US43_C0011G0018 [Candidatus Levybacteria bacterium GW2011_GWA1_37_16]KKQ42026.1 MAG: hypothetical protein US59_C0017G0019 [Candidatus Levybacteria bacterium GW2011_GWB1_37_8]